MNRSQEFTFVIVYIIQNHLGKRKAFAVWVTTDTVQNMGHIY